jgi:5-methylcytosine-specific restriction endonuclease McrA
VAFVVHKTMEETKGFYKTAAWLKCREAYIKSVGGLCERCLADGKIVPGYIVHHKIHLNPFNVTDPSITLNWNNLEYLCLECHNQEHFKQKVAKRYAIDADGKVFIENV